MILDSRPLMCRIVYSGKHLKLKSGGSHDLYHHTLQAYYYAAILPDLTGEGTVHFK